MTVSYESALAVVIANKAVRLTFTADTGNFVRIWCTAAPSGSRLRDKLDENRSTRVHMQDVDSGKSFDYTFDVAGAYQIAAQELTKGAAPYGGGYQNAPDAARAETILGETALTFYVASRLKSTIGQGQDVADLILHVANDLIRETTIAVHGRATPAVEKPRTGKAKTAAEGTFVASALATLIGTSASGSLGNLGGITTDIIDRFNDHAASGTFHAVADTDNMISPAFRNPAGPDALKRSVSAVLKALSSHMRNDSVLSPAGTGSQTWHTSVSWATLPLFESSGSVADHVRALADAWRSFEAHRVSSAHSSVDGTNALAALPALLNVHRFFLTDLASLNPTTPVTENSAKTILVHGAGFEES